MASCRFCGYEVGDCDLSDFCPSCHNPIMDDSNVDRRGSDGTTKTLKSVTTGSLVLCFVGLVTLGVIPGFLIWPALKPVCWIFNIRVGGESNFGTLWLTSSFWPLSIALGYMLSEMAKSKIKKFIIFVVTTYGWLIITFFVFYIIGNAL